VRKLLSKALLTEVLPAVTVQGDGVVLLHTRSSTFISGRAMKPANENTNVFVRLQKIQPDHMPLDWQVVGSCHSCKYDAVFCSYVTAQHT
jgi:hypothetical protein